MARIYIVGYGKMGRAIEKICLARGDLEPVAINDFTQLNQTVFTPGDIVIEFTGAPGCLANYKHLIAQDVCLVTGTTGWLDHEEEIRDLVSRHKGAFLHAANFSIGVHIFWRLIERAAALFNAQDKYDVFTHEIHHPHKKDSPSGTALHTARLLLNGLSQKKTIISGDVEGPLPADALHVSASRGGYQAGEHSVYFDGPDDMITLSHHAKGRDGFANGALDCALWLQGKRGFFTINDYLEDILS